MSQAEIRKSLNVEEVREWLRETDGYSILEPEFFRRLGFPECKIQSLASTFSSDPSLGKNAATRSDGSDGDVWGISEFAAVDALADWIGAAPCHEWFGRGKNFRYTAARILEALS